MCRPANFQRILKLLNKRFLLIFLLYHISEARYKRLWLVVVSGTAMVMIIVFFLIHLLRTCLPAVPDSFFIFNEDEDNKLILSTKFVAPSHSLRQAAEEPKVPSDISSFRFKSIPVPSISKEDISFSKTSRESPLELPDNASYNSNLPELELHSLTYKEEIRKDVQEIIQNLPLKSNINIIEDSKPPRKVASKRPRFEETEFVNITGTIEPYERSARDHKEARRKHKPDERERSGFHKKSLRSSIEVAHMQIEKREHFASFSEGQSSKRRSSQD